MMQCVSDSHHSTERQSPLEKQLYIRDVNSVYCVKVQNGI